MTVAIAIFARAPVAGQAKTRVIPRLGSKGAAALQHALIQRTVQTAVAAGIGPVALWCSPDCEHPAFGTLSKRFGVRLHPQCGADLGARMLDAFSRLCRHSPVLLVGTDCPALTPGDLRASGAALREGHDAVFVPAEDGGYVLVGLRHAVASLFHAMPWGSEEVMNATRERLHDAGLRWQELAASWDVDRPEDFDRLRASGLMADYMETIP